MRSIATLLLFAIPCAASAATYQVGPGRSHSTLTALFDAVTLRAGDVVEVDYGSYSGGVIMRNGGSAGNPVTIRGIRNAAGQRPRMSGGTNVIEFRLADHVVFQGFDISGGSNRCVYHHSADLTLRDLVVHDCTGQGIASSDTDSGSLTIEYSEVYGSGSGTQAHPLYLASDEVAHPGSVFRLQYNYLHAGVGGNLVKSRSERNEIYYNWIEGGLYRELELIGPDPGGVPDGWNDNLAREDSDVVGNVIVHTSTAGANVVRLGGDGNGSRTNGRYRFVNNTIIFRGVNGTFLQPYDGIESIELHNNVIWSDTGSAPRFIREDDADWVGGISRITGTNNWIQTGTTYLPSGLSGTFSGPNPGFVNAGGRNYIPNGSSMLLDHGTRTTVTAGYDLPNPLFPPRFEPFMAVNPIVGAALVRPSDAAIDIGAYEVGSPGADAPIWSNGFDR